MNAVLQSSSLFDAIAERLSGLISRFGLENARSDILEAYNLICHESLALDVRRSPPEFSRLNADGTPLQFSLSLASGRPSPLQFVAEPGAPTSSMSERIATGRQTAQAIAEMFGVRREIESLAGLLEQMAPENDPALRANTSGVYWIGVSFSSGSAPALTVYINSKWGKPAEQWERIRAFAAWFSLSNEWKSIERKLLPGMAPLGTAVTVSAGHPLSGRVYTTAYGLPFNFYRSLFADFCSDAVDRFAEAILGEDRAYPIRSAACSFEFGVGGRLAGAKFELCAHCAFANDAEAYEKSSSWLRSEGYDDALYSDAVEILTSGGGLSTAKLPTLHSYLGTGVRAGQRYSSIYLNPGPPLRGD